MNNEFKDWPIDKQIEHIEKMFKDGATEYGLENPVPLADVIDCMDYWGPWLIGRFKEQQKELTALRKIAEAANDVGYSWSLANYPHPRVAKPMYILKEALKEWRGEDEWKRTR